jgi:Ca2+-transporting ATPase
MQESVEVAREPMFLLLIAGSIVYIALGDTSEALALLASVLIIIGITLYQERRTERALDALRDLSSPRALVIRDGTQQRIAGRDVARGDMVLLSEGDRVPADAVLRWGLNLTIDESLLTGESAPVRKVACAAEASESAGRATSRPGGDDQPFVYSGTLVVQGRGAAEVLATGPRSEIGKIGQALQGMQAEQTPLQRETRRLVWILAVWGLLLCATLVVGYGLIRGQWLDGILAGIALAMAVLPEEFPVVLTVFLALGAWRMARRRVLTRRTPAVETLGAATALCVDKTGTLTQNRMRVRRLFAQGATYESSATGTGVPDTFRTLGEYSALACQSDPSDPMEKAIFAFTDAAAPPNERLYTRWNRVREYPLTPALLAVTQVWAPREGERVIVACKGAPEAIARLCHLSESERADLIAHVAEMGADGLRVLGVARSQQDTTQLPERPEAFAFELVGLIGLANPVRPEAPSAVQECYDAGVRVIMMTGDYPATAQAIARQIGLHDSDRCITGPMLDAMDDDALGDRIATTNIFARMVPEQKLRLIRALKARGEVVAMTGDGVNDAPALKAAHIGIAMGGRGTDVAREAASLVLLDDDFLSIVGAVRMGRRIFDNLRKAMSYVLAIHIPIAGMALLPVLFGWPLVLMPVQIVFLELIIDPASSIVFEAEPEEADVMRRPPRDPSAPLFTRAMVAISLLNGLGMFAIVLALFRFSLASGASEDAARALTFTTLVLANLALVLTTRSRTRSILNTLRRRNVALWWVVGGAVAVLTLVFGIPFLRDLFGFAMLQPAGVLLCLAAVVASAAWCECIKFASTHWRRTRR